MRFKMIFSVLLATIFSSPHGFAGKGKEEEKKKETSHQSKNKLNQNTVYYLQQRQVHGNIEIPEHLQREHLIQRRKCLRQRRKDLIKKLLEESSQILREDISEEEKIAKLNLLHAEWKKLLLPFFTPISHETNERRLAKFLIHSRFEHWVMQEAANQVLVHIRDQLEIPVRDHVTPRVCGQVLDHYDKVMIKMNHVTKIIEQSIQQLRDQSIKQHLSQWFPLRDQVCGQVEDDLKWIFNVPSLELESENLNQKLRLATHYACLIYQLSSVFFLSFNYEAPENFLLNSVGAEKILQILRDIEIRTDEDPLIETWFALLRVPLLLPLQESGSDSPIEASSQATESSAQEKENPPTPLATATTAICMAALLSNLPSYNSSN